MSNLPVVDANGDPQNIRYHRNSDGSLTRITRLEDGASVEVREPVELTPGTVSAIREGAATDATLQAVQTAIQTLHGEAAKNDTLAAVLSTLTGTLEVALNTASVESMRPLVTVEPHRGDGNGTVSYGTPVVATQIVNDSGGARSLRGNGDGHVLAGRATFPSPES